VKLVKIGIFRAKLCDFCIDTAFLYFFKHKGAVLLNTYVMCKNPILRNWLKEHQLSIEKMLRCQYPDDMVLVMSLRSLARRPLLRPSEISYLNLIWNHLILGQAQLKNNQRKYLKNLTKTIDKRSKRPTQNPTGGAHT
jgi:hypothetical protein